ncbi:MAG: hypothetical protein ACI9R3_001378 [Verrucomicrobiales bacterium]|jgi:hypothetical protein
MRQIRDESSDEVPTENPTNRTFARIWPAQNTIRKVKHMTNPNIETPLETVYAAYIGIDWADKRHAIALQAATAGKIEESWLNSDPESAHTWARSLGKRFEGVQFAIGVELSRLRPPMTPPLEIKVPTN